MKWHFFVFATSLANLIQSLMKGGLVGNFNQTISKQCSPHIATQAQQVMQESRKRELFHCELVAKAPPLGTRVQSSV